LAQNAPNSASVEKDFRAPRRVTEEAAQRVAFSNAASKERPAAR
jgi:hypothetical protein